MQASPVDLWAFSSGSIAITPGHTRPTCNAKRKTPAFSVLCAYKPPQWNPQVNLLAFSLLDPTSLLASSCQSWPASAFNICLTLLTRKSADLCPGHLVTIRSAGHLSVHIFKAGLTFCFYDLKPNNTLYPPSELLLWSSNALLFNGRFLESVECVHFQRTIWLAVTWTDTVHMSILSPNAAQVQIANLLYLSIASISVNICKCISNKYLVTSRIVFFINRSLGKLDSWLMAADQILTPTKELAF